MIKINLIVTKRKKKAKPIPMFLVAGVGLLALSLAGSFYAASLVENEIETLTRKKIENNKEMERLKGKMAEVKKFEKLNREVQERGQVIKDLTKNQGLPVIILQEVSKTLTKGIWIVSMSISKGSVKISGVGFSNSDIVSYVQKLKASEVFSKVLFHGTTRKAGTKTKGKRGVDTYTFSVSFKVDI
jgi:type IV pilus assembly protein PilN